AWTRCNVETGVFVPGAARAGVIDGGLLASFVLEWVRRTRTCRDSGAECRGTARRSHAPRHPPGARGEHGMKKLVLASVAVLAMAAFVAAPATADEKKAGTKDKAIQGEVLDLACYIAHGASGAGHADCAKECAKGGQPMGLLSADGTVYVLLADH